MSEVVSRKTRGEIRESVRSAMENLRENFGGDEDTVQKIVHFRVDQLFFKAGRTKYPENAVRLRLRAEDYLRAIGY